MQQINEINSRIEGFSDVFVVFDVVLTFISCFRSAKVKINKKRVVQRNS